MNRIDKIKEMVAKARIPKALKELRSLIKEYGLEDDYENLLISLQSRHTTFVNNEQMGLLDANSLSLERNRIVNSINHYIGDIEDDLPEEALQEQIPTPTAPPHTSTAVPPTGPTSSSGSVMSPEEALAKEIESLTNNISHNTNKLEYLRNKLIIESNPSTQFNLETEIEKAEKELDEDRARLSKLKTS